MCLLLRQQACRPRGQALTDAAGMESVFTTRNKTVDPGVILARKVRGQRERSGAGSSQGLHDDKYTEWHAHCIHTFNNPFVLNRGPFVT